jgi:hypothetical protein
MVATAVLEEMAVDSLSHYHPALGALSCSMSSIMATMVSMG